MDTSNANEGNDSQSSAAMGAALLLVIGEPFSEEHKKLILEEVTKGFRCWDVEGTGIDINDELAQIANKADLGEEGPNGERIIRHSSDNLVAEILVNPQTQTVTLAVKNFLATPTKHKHLIHAGHAFQGSGAWILQDDTYTFNNFANAFKDQDVANALKQQKGSSLSMYTNSKGDWSNGHISKNDFSKILNVSLNPSEKLDSLHGVMQFAAYVSNFVKVSELNELLQSSDVVGNIRFSRPTLYIFPGCQGDSALFGISGFNLLVNGGYSRKACFWDFTRHLDRIDAALMTHLGTDNLYGLGAVLQRKSIENVHPEIGFMYINASDKLKEITANEKADKGESLEVNLAEEGNKMIQYAKQIGQVPQPCTRSQSGQTVEPVNLFHKVGIGSLDMYILNPITDSKELKEFYQQWNQKVAQFGTNQHVPLPNTLSICALLVWRPSDPNDNITRIFFPGNAPQHKVIEGLEKLKTLNILKHPKCTATSLQAKPATKKPTGLSSKPPSRAKASPVTTPKNEVPKRESTPVKATTRSKIASAPKAKKEDVNKKTSKAAEKVKDEKTDKTKSSASSSPSKGSMKSSNASTPKEMSTPTKEPEPVIQPEPEPAVTKAAPEPEPELAPFVNGVESSVDPPAPAGFSSEPLQPTPSAVQEPEPQEIEPPAPVPEPTQIMSAEPVMDKNKMLELGIYDDDQDIDEDLNTQKNQQNTDMFGGSGMTDSMHENLIGDVGSNKAMQGSFHGDLMTGSFHESMFDNKPFEDQGFVENGCTPVDEVTTPEDSTSEEIQPQALPEPQAYSPTSYSQEPDVIPSVPIKEEPASLVPLETALPQQNEPDLLPVKQDSPDEISVSQGIEEQSTAPVEPLVEAIEEVKKEQMPVELETPDEVENSLPVDDLQMDIQEKDSIEDSEKDSAPAPMGDISPAPAEDLKPFEDQEVKNVEPESLPSMPDQPDIEDVETAKTEDLVAAPPSFNEASVEELVSAEPISDDFQSGEIGFNDELAQREQSPEGFLEPEMQSLAQSESPEIADIIERPKSPEPEELGDDSEIPNDSKLTPEPIGEIPSESPDLIGEVKDAVNEFETQEPVQTIPEVEPEVMPEQVEPEVMPGQVEPEVMSGQVEPEVMPGQVEAKVMPGQVEPEQVEPEVMPEPIEEKLESQAPVMDDVIDQVAQSQSANLMDNDLMQGENIEPMKQPIVEQTPEISVNKEEAVDRPDTPESLDERAESPDSQADAEMLQRDSLERDIKEQSPAVESDEQRDSIERDSAPQSKESSPEDQRDSIERSYEEDDETDETDDSEDDDDDEPESSSFEQEEATDEKCLIQDSMSEDQKLGIKQQETDSLAPISDNILTPGSETMLTPESETTDVSHGGQLGYHQIDEQEDRDSFEGVDSFGAAAQVPQSTNPFGQPFEQVDGSYPSGQMANPFDDMVERPTGLNPFAGFEQQPPAPSGFDDSSPEDEFRPQGGPMSFNPLAEWGEPMGLPSPPPPEDKGSAKKTSRPGSAAKLGDKKANGDVKKPASAAPKKSGLSRPAPKQSNGVPEKSKTRPASATSSLNTSKTGATNTSRLSMGGKTATATKTRPTSAPAKDKPSAKSTTPTPKTNGTKRPGTATGSRTSPATVKMPPLPAFNPYYVDLTYIPNHGNPDYSDIEFFKRIRARYYVLSALSPNTQILDSLLEAKKTWEDKELSVTVIPTYDNETLRLWMTLHKDKLAEEKVEIAPSASRCTIQLQDHETSSSAYRLEF